MDIVQNNNIDISKMSEADKFLLIPIEKRQKILNSFSKEELAALKYNWKFNQRPAQREPEGDWSDWLILAGRSWGKTKCGSEWIRSLIDSNQAGRIALVGRTPGDVRDVMLEGDSGIMNVFPPHQRPTYQPALRKVTFYNGAVAYTYSSAEPNALRGPQHDAAWGDEPAAWYYPEETYNMLKMGLRLGKNPRMVLTTTPRPIPFINSLLYQVDHDGNILKDGDGNYLRNPATAISTGTSWENQNNVSAKWFSDLERMYVGTRLGRQELYAELLADVEGALITQAILDRARFIPPFINNEYKMPEFKVIGIGVDPATTNNKTSDTTGIIVGALGVDGIGYILEDLTMKGSPDEWGNAVNNAYLKHFAGKIVAESNQGGDMVKYVLKTINPNLPITLIHASTSKSARAQPIAALYEQGRIKHIGSHAKLESEWITWVPGEGESPGRIDAEVHLLTNLFDLYKQKVHTQPVVQTRSIKNSSVYY